MSALGSLGAANVEPIGTRDLELQTTIYAPRAAPMRLTQALASGEHNGYAIELLLGAPGGILVLQLTDMKTGARAAREEIDLATVASAWAGAAIADLELTTVVAEHNAAAETKENDE